MKAIELILSESPAAYINDYLSDNDGLAVCAWMGIQFLLINWVR